jgi:hypothetical protein
MEVVMSEKPSYLGLLNAIAIAEAQAHEYLTEWIEVCDNPDVKAVLSTVAAREGEHGMAFAKRINELGYCVLYKDGDDGSAKRMSIAASDRSDLEKMEEFGLGRLDTGDKPDFFDNFFTDHSIDIATGALLGRYIAEERDSARLLSGCYRALKANANGSGSPAGSAVDDRLGSLEAKLDAVCEAIGQLQTTMSSAVNGNGNGESNGRSRPGPRARSRTSA